MRCYVLIAGGLQESEFLGSTATFTLGTFGGHCGRPLREGDVLTVGSDRAPLGDRPARATIDEQPSIGLGTYGTTVGCKDAGRVE